MDFQYCPRCEAFNPPGATHCEQCKAELPEVAEFAPPPAAPEAEPTPTESQPAGPLVEDESRPDETPPFEAAPEVVAKAGALEAEIQAKPGANALYLQLSQLYATAGRKDLAIRTLERFVEHDPKNVYMRHRLAQLTGTVASAAASNAPAAGAPTAVVPGAGTPPTAAAGAAPAPRPMPPTARAAMATRPAYQRPQPRRRLPRWAIVGLLVALPALALGVRLLFFPGPKRAVTGTFSAVAPKWSPTGRHFAFVIQETSRNRLGIYDVGKAEMRSLADLAGSDASAFAWSPDGKRIAYVGSAEGGWGDAVFVADLESGRAHRVAAGSLPTWAPDGSTLLMWCGMETSGGDTETAASLPEGEEDLAAAAASTSYESSQPTGPCQIDADTGAVIRRSADLGEDGLAWGSSVSPVLAKIAYEKAAVDETAAPATRGDGEFYDLVDSVTARGARNVYEGSRDLNRELQARRRQRLRSGDQGPSYARDVYVADFEGGPEVRLTSDGRSGAPSWTPDGQRLLFLSDGALWLMNADGSGRQLLYKGKLADPPAAQLSPDGRHVFFVAPVEADAGVARVMTGEDPFDLHLARVGSGTAKRLANRHPFKQRYALSPDGKRIVYEVLAETGSIVHGGGRSELWLMRR